MIELHEIPNEFDIQLAIGIVDVSVISRMEK
jgi:hypothetical protein